MVGQLCGWLFNRHYPWVLSVEMSQLADAWVKFWSMLAGLLSHIFVRWKAGALAG